MPSSAVWRCSRAWTRLVEAPWKTWCHSLKGKLLVTSADGAARGKAAAYVDSLPARIAEAVRLVNERMVPAKAAAAIGREESVSFNRRYLMQGRIGLQVHPNVPNLTTWKPGNTVRYRNIRIFRLVR